MIRCKVNDKCYVGQSTNIKNRWRTHKYKLRHNKHSSKEMNKDWNTYGEDNFEFKIIQECTKDELYDLEKKYIKEYRGYEDGYNQTIGGDKMEGYVCSEETKDKIKKLVSGENNPFYGKKHTEETRKKMSENHADFNGSKHPKAMMVIGILPSGLILEPMSQIELANLLGLEKHTIINLRRSGESYKSRYKKYKYLEGLRVIGIETLDKIN